MEKLEGTLRIGFQNINGFNFDKEKVKYTRVFNLLKDFKTDLAERKPKRRLWDSTRGWLDGINLNIAYNRIENNISKRCQSGSVVSLITKKIAYKVIDEWGDNTLLGR